MRLFCEIITSTVTEPQKNRYTDRYLPVTNRYSPLQRLCFVFLCFWTVGEHVCFVFCVFGLPLPPKTLCLNTAATPPKTLLRA